MQYQLQADPGQSRSTEADQDRAGQQKQTQDRAVNSQQKQSSTEADQDRAGQQTRTEQVNRSRPRQSSQQKQTQDRTVNRSRPRTEQSTEADPGQSRSRPRTEQVNRSRPRTEQSECRQSCLAGTGDLGSGVGSADDLAACLASERFATFFSQSRTYRTAKHADCAPRQLFIRVVVIPQRRFRGHFISTFDIHSMDMCALRKEQERTSETINALVESQENFKTLKLLMRLPTALDSLPSGTSRDLQESIRDVLGQGGLRQDSGARVHEGNVYSSDQHNENSSENQVMFI
ncbi:hypothetical protein C7M84_006913 [Penaeus vannamei]|uniref:Uncharacterized protein n=1 Tax=Penaeus vannamei TaxID=6689 RepID=A0A423TDM5_PENVA|nr:hypothetical protein C7M84_006913 [Penaeus vannamei]